MPNSELRLHVREPRIQPRVVSNLSVHNAIFFLFNFVVTLFAPRIARVESDTFFPLGATTVEDLLDLDVLAYQIKLLLVSFGLRVVVIITWCLRTDVVDLVLFVGLFVSVKCLKELFVCC